MAIIRLRESPHLKAESRHLRSFARNVYSQFGEDGIISEIFRRIGEGARTSVEFGAWDGRYLSNTAHLIDQGWRGLFIEGNAERFRDLEQTYADNDRVIRMNRFVDLDEASDYSLNNLLREGCIPETFDILSIDIDGNDYHVWRTLSSAFAPRVIVIEFNPTIPNDVIFIQDPVPTVNQGSSLAALIELGKERNYELVATTDCNAIFVRRQDFPLFNIADNSIDAIHQSRFTSAFFQLYDGTIVLAGCQRLIWHDIPIEPEAMQVLPAEKRRFPDAAG